MRAPHNLFFLPFNVCITVLVTGVPVLYSQNLFLLLLEVSTPSPLSCYFLCTFSFGQPLLCALWFYVFELFNFHKYFCVWLVSLNIVSFRLIQVVTNGSSIILVGFNLFRPKQSITFVSTGLYPFYLVNYLLVSSPFSIKSVVFLTHCCNITNCSSTSDSVLDFFS